MSGTTGENFLDKGSDTYGIRRPASPSASELVLKDLPSSATPQDVIRRVQVASDTADFARRGAEAPAAPKDQKVLDDQARRSLDAAWANPGAAAALRSAGVVETTSKADFAAARYDNVSYKLDAAVTAAAKPSASASSSASGGETATSAASQYWKATAASAPPATTNAASASEAATRRSGQTL